MGVCPGDEKIWDWSLDEDLSPALKNLPPIDANSFYTDSISHQVGIECVYCSLPKGYKNLALLEKND